MTGLQKLILVALAILVISECGVAGWLARSYLVPDEGVMMARPLEAQAKALPTPTATLTPIPTSTPTRPPTASPLPSTTPTRVVIHMPTTDTPTPTNTLVLSPTPTGTVRSAAKSGTKKAGATPTPSYPFKAVASQVYDTTNHFFVMYAQITSNNTLLAGYRIVGTHVPSKRYFESQPSCPDLCKASGPKAVDSNVQEGNVAFEADMYDTGAYFLVVQDPQGQQVSDVIQVPVDADHRQWFFYHFDPYGAPGSGAPAAPPAPVATSAPTATPTKDAACENSEDDYHDYVRTQIDNKYQPTLDLYNSYLQQAIASNNAGDVQHWQQEIADVQAQMQDEIDTENARHNKAVDNCGG